MTNFTQIHQSFSNGTSIDRSIISNGNSTISRTRISNGGNDSVFCEPRFDRPRRYGHRHHGGFENYNNFRNYAGMGDFGDREYYHHRTGGEKFGDSIGSIGNGLGFFALGANMAMGFIRNIGGWFNR